MPHPDSPIGTATTPASHTAPAKHQMANVLGATRAADALVEAVTAGLAGSLNLRRTALKLLTMIRPGLADWSIVVLPGMAAGRLCVAGGDDTGFHDPTLDQRDVRRTALGKLLRTGRTDLVHVALGDDTESSLAELIPHPRLVAEAATLRPADMLGVALTARGVTFGALVMVRGEGRGFGDADVALGQRVAARAAVALDSARLYEERSRVATVLQRSLRPPSMPTIDGVELAARYRPAAQDDGIGGDFYDVHGHGEDWLLTIGDVCGKGVEAAAVTGRARQTLRTAAHFDRRPDHLLASVNTVLYDAHTETLDPFVTIACALACRDPRGGMTVDVAVAGHHAPFVLRADGTIDQPDVRGMAVGLTRHADYPAVRLHLDPGDTMLMFTDGIDEADGPDGRYGLDRLAAVLGGHGGAGAEVICDVVEQDVMEYLDGGPHDDIALLAMTCRR